MEYQYIIYCPHRQEDPLWILFILGIGSPVFGSSTKKVNTKSTTESELVAVNDAIGYVEWTSLYSKDQVKKLASKG